jgi:hypothetical protein
VPVPVGARVALGVDRAAGEATSHNASDYGSQEESAWATAREATHLVHEVARLAGADPVGDATEPVCRLGGELGGGAVPPAIVGHLAQLAGKAADAVGGVLLPGPGLRHGLAANFAEQVPGLAFRLLRHLTCLLGRRACHVAARIGRGTADISGLLLGDLAGGRRHVLTCLLRHISRYPKPASVTPGLHQLHQSDQRTRSNLEADR